jgi:hypothetical protein
MRGSRGNEEPSDDQEPDFDIDESAFVDLIESNWHALH